MSTKHVNVFPFKEYNSTINRYSKGNQRMEKEYKGILESETGEAIYDKENPSLGAHATLEIRPNLPVYNKVIGDVKIEDQNVPVYKTFWQYKQPAGTIFTDWTSAGLSHTKEDMSIRHLPLYGDEKLKDPTLVLSNTNNIRNNFQRYGKEYLTSTNMLNAEAFSNGASYLQGNSTYRNSTKDIQNTILHGSFGNKEDGDLYVRNENVLRVDLPENFANTTLSSWQKANPAFVLLHPDKHKHLRYRVQFGTLNLDAMKLTGLSCLTEEFGVIPTGYNYPTDVLSNTDELPPVTNPDYYNVNNQDHHKQGKGEGLYCSANTNYVTMPRNNLHPDLDTSFSVGPGNNSVTLGSVMSPKLSDFIQSTLYEYNRDFIFMSIYNYLSVELQNKIKHISPYLFDKSGKLNTDYNKIHDEGEKYKYIYNIQRNLLTLEQGHPELEVFIANLSIIKIGGHSSDPSTVGYVLCSELSESRIPIRGKGAFVLLPTMLAPDLFTVQQSGHPDCIKPGATYQENAAKCGFRGPANTWQQKPYPGGTDPTFVPNMFDDPENPNNFIYNLDNPYLGRNLYGAPSTF